MSCVFGSQQSRITDPVRGQLHTSCSQYLCRRWWPWFESAPVENWIPLLSGKLHLWNFSPEANFPSLGFTVLTSQLLLTHHSEWCRFFFLVRFSLGQHLAVSIFIGLKYTSLALTPAFAFLCRRYWQGRTETSIWHQQRLYSSPFLATHKDLSFCEAGCSSNVHSPFPYNIYIFFWLRWVFVAVCVLSLVAVSGGYSSLQCTDFSLWWFILLQSYWSSALGTRASVAAARGLQ